MAGKRQCSKYWEFFELYLDNATNKQRTLCKMCPNNLSLAFNRNTSAMKAHLYGKHKINLVESSNNSKSDDLSQKIVTQSLAQMVTGRPVEQPKRAIKKRPKSAPVLCRTAPTNTVIRKPVISNQSAAPPNDRSSRVTKKLIEMFAVDVCPLTIVDGIGFRRLVKEMDPAYNLPTLPVLRRHLDQQYRERKAELVRRLSTVDSVALSVDMWCARGRQSLDMAGDWTGDTYLTLSCHYIDDEWDTQFAVLATRRLPHDPGRSGQDIAHHIEEVQREFGLTGISAVTHDDSPAMDTACQVLGVSAESSAVCFGRVLHRAVNEGLFHAGTQSCLDACHALVAHIATSPPAAEELRLHQRELCRAGDSTPPILPTEFPSGWSGTYAMLQALLSNRLAIYSVFSDPQATFKVEDRGLIPTDDQWELAEKLCGVLRPLDVVVRQMASELYPDVGAIFPLVHVIIHNQLTLATGDREEIVHFKTNCADALMRRFKIGQEEESDDVIACCLHPTFKKLKFLSAEAKSRVVARLKQTVATVRLTPLPLPSSITEVTPTTTSQLECAGVRTGGFRGDTSAASAMKYLMEDMYDTSDEEDESCDSEVERYLADNHRIQQTLPWWRTNHTRYPRLAVLARRLLARPATAVPTDRVFNGSVDARTTLDPDTVDPILFLNSCDRPRKVVVVDSAAAPVAELRVTPAVSRVAISGGGNTVHEQSHQDGQETGTVAVANHQEVMSHANQPVGLTWPSEIEWTVQ